MAETTYFAQVQIPYLTGQARDVATNTFAFRGLSAATSQEDDAEAVAGVLQSFYDTANPTSGIALSGFMSEVLDTTIARFKVYDLGDDRPRFPRADEIANIGPPNAGLPAPSEVCVFMEARRTPTSGFNPARESGGISFGPIAYIATGAGPTVQQEPVVNTPIVSGNLRIAMAEAAIRLKADANAVDLAWSIFSRASAGPDTEAAPWTDTELLTATKPVLQVRININFDIQNRRGERTISGAWTTL